MAWTSPMTAVAGTVFTAAQFNLHVRDNLNETAPAKATTAGGYFVATAANAIAQRTSNSATVATFETTTSTTYTSLATVGPSVTVTTGTSALVFVNAQLRNATGTAGSMAGFAVSGNTTLAADDARAVWNQDEGSNRYIRAGITHRVTGLNPGSHTFTMEYRVSAGTGGFTNREIVVLPL